jgi:hypothetical protein
MEKAEGTTREEEEEEEEEVEENEEEKCDGVVSAVFRDMLQSRDTPPGVVLPGRVSVMWTTESASRIMVAVGVTKNRSGAASGDATWVDAIAESSVEADAEAEADAKAEAEAGAGAEWMTAVEGKNGNSRGAFNVNECHSTKYSTTLSLRIARLSTMPATRQIGSGTRTAVATDKDAPVESTTATGRPTSPSWL